MIEKLGFLVRFWELKARHALGAALSTNERLELLSLMQLAMSDFKAPEPGPVSRNNGALPAQMIGEGALFTVDIRMVSAGALVVTGARHPTPGARVILRTSDAVSGVEYELPCTVMWVYDSSPCTMSLVVDGIPERSNVVPVDPQLRNAMALRRVGRTERLVG